MSLEFKKLEQLKTFICGCCYKSITSKNVPVWTKKDGTKVDICNGCYGYMKAHGEEQQTACKKTLV